MPFFDSPPFLLTIDWGGAMLDGPWLILLCVLGLRWTCHQSTLCCNAGSERSDPPAVLPKIKEVQTQCLRLSRVSTPRYFARSPISGMQPCGAGMPCYGVLFAFKAERVR